MLGGSDPFDFDSIYSPDRNVWRRWRRHRQDQAIKGTFDLPIDDMLSSPELLTPVASVSPIPVWAPDAAAPMVKDPAQVAAAPRDPLPLWAVAAGAAGAAAGGALVTGQSPGWAGLQGLAAGLVAAWACRRTGQRARLVITALAVAAAIAAPLAWMAAPPVAAMVLLFTRSRAGKGVTSRGVHRHSQETNNLEAGS